jgi:hypothetical protein
VDYHRVTEEAAEGIALALVSSGCNWIVLRRLQRGEVADWLLRGSNGALVALEVSGLDAPDNGRRLREKLAQVHKARFDVKAACLVVLAKPQASLSLQEGDV